MPKGAQVAEEVVETLDQTPNNNMEGQDKQPEPKSFTISTEGTNELVNCLNEVVLSKYVKQVIFNVINENFKPVF